jgi:hypothetical protein
MLVNPQGFVQNQVSASFEARQFYYGIIYSDIKLYYFLEMTKTENFMHPITWESINPSEYDG